MYIVHVQCTFHMLYNVHFICTLYICIKCTFHMLYNVHFICTLYICIKCTFNMYIHTRHDYMYIQYVLHVHTICSTIITVSQMSCDLKLNIAVGRKCTWTASGCPVCFTTRFHMADAPVGITKYRWCIMIT
jgi:hypothetical protein